MDLKGISCDGPSGGIAGTSGNIITNYEFVPFEVNNNEIIKLQIDCDLNSGDKFSDVFTVTFENQETGLRHDVNVDIMSKVY